MVKTAEKKKSKSERSIKDSDSFTELKTALGGELQGAFDAMADHRVTWDDKESLLLLKNNDQLATEYQSQVNDGRLSTLVWERTARVMGQVPKGMVRAMTKADKGKSQLMDLALWRYIIPNANATMDHLVKLRQWNFYSAVYGSMPMLYFWRVDDDYVGPDCYLVPIRNFFPQPGRTSIEDCDWVMISTMMTVGELKRYAEDKTNTWDSAALNRVIQKAKKGAKTSTKDPQKTSLVERQYQSSQTQGGKGDFAEVEVVTKYEAGSDGHWISFCPEYENEVIRDVENQHGNAKIPVIMKHCFPLPDSIIGLGDFERGKTLQFAMNSLINLYLDSVKMKLFPPILVNTQETIMSSLEWGPGAVWKVKGPGAIEEFDFSPQGYNSFNSTYANLNAALQSQMGSTTTEVNSEEAGDPTFGKTPEGLKLQGARESTRDNWDRFFMEKAIGDLYEAFVNMMAKQSKDSKEAVFHIFGKEVEEISKVEETKDVVELFDSKQGAKVKIGHKDVGDCEYRFLIDEGTTQKEDQKEAFQNLMQFFQVLPNLGQVLQEEGHRINWPWFIRQMVVHSGVEGAADNLILDDEQAEQKRQEKLQQTAEATAAGKDIDFSNVNYKDLPEDVKRAAEAREYGAPSQSKSPSEQKYELDMAKIHIARQKLDLEAEKLASKEALDKAASTRADQAHLAADPNPGLAEPVDPDVDEMDKLTGFQIDPDVQRLAEEETKAQGVGNG